MFQRIQLPPCSGSWSTWNGSEGLGQLGPRVLMGRTSLLKFMSWNVNISSNGRKHVPKLGSCRQGPVNLLYRTLQGNYMTCMNKGICNHQLFVFNDNRLTKLIHWQNTSETKLLGLSGLNTVITITRPHSLGTLLQGSLTPGIGCSQTTFMNCNFKIKFDNILRHTYELMATRAYIH